MIGKEMFDFPYKLVLGSQSPRRRELLSGLDLPFEIRVAEGLEERYPASLPPHEIPVYLAKLKAEALRQTLSPDELLLTADTVVLLDSGEVLGKPVDRHAATEMLRRLSGHRHSVVTGVAFTLTDGIHFVSSSRSEVYFSPLCDDEIAYYIDRYAPYDKAGAYGIQEWIGYIGIERIEGSFYNVMGLPIQFIYKTLREWRLYEKNIVPL